MILILRYCGFDGTGNYTTNHLNQYESIRTEIAISDETVDYDYDNNGNLTDIDDVEMYKYDAENRLTEAPTANTQYTYCPLGRRISKTVDGVVTHYVYDGSQVIGEYGSADTLIREFVYGAGIDETVRMTEFHKTMDIAGPSGPGADDVVDIHDLRQMAAAWLTTSDQAGLFDPASDLNADGRIDNCDSDILAANWHLSGSELAGFNEPCDQISSILGYILDFFKKRHFLPDFFLDISNLGCYHILQLDVMKDVVCLFHAVAIWKAGEYKHSAIAAVLWHLRVQS
jgi:YD repeat-containing protein